LFRRTRGRRSRKAKIVAGTSSPRRVRRSSQRTTSHRRWELTGRWLNLRSSTLVSLIPAVATACYSWNCRCSTAVRLNRKKKGSGNNLVLGAWLPRRAGLFTTMLADLVYEQTQACGGGRGPGNRLRRGECTPKGGLALMPRRTC